MSAFAFIALLIVTSPAVGDPRAGVVLVLADDVGDDELPDASGWQVEREVAPPSVGARLARSGALARSHGAVAVLWLERVGEGGRRLLIVDTRLGRMWFRDLPAAASRAERTEWLALIVPRMADAIAAHADPDATPVEVRIGPPARAPQPPPREPRLAVGVAYVGAATMQDEGWRSGAGLSLGARCGAPCSSGWPIELRPRSRLATNGSPAACSSTRSTPAWGRARRAATGRWRRRSTRSRSSTLVTRIP